MNKPPVQASEPSFILISEEYLPLIYAWFNEPHIQAFYSLRTWTMEEVRQKLTAYIQGAEDLKCYIVFIDKTPIGYVQCYPVKKHPWDDQDLTDEIIQDSAGIDLFIGEREFIGKGLGCRILDTFLQRHIWPHYRYCLADPDIRNEACMRLFKKCAFQEHQRINSKDALLRPVTLQLFIKERE